MTKISTTLAVLLLAVAATGVEAQTAASKHKNQQQEMLEQMDARIEKLEAMVASLTTQMAARDKDLADAKRREDVTHGEVEAAAKQQRLRAESTLESVAKNSGDITGLQTTVSDLKASSSAMASTVSVTQATTKELEAPSGIHFLGVTLTPGGYLAAETVSRQRAVGGDINTPFSSIPFTGQTAADFSEFNGSGRQSRISLMAEGKVSNATLRGYYEADFLSSGITSNSNESNSYTLRQRQLWAQAELNSGWIFTGGQMWSLATEYKRGLMNTSEQIPATIDAQYNVGFTWARQYGFRVVKKVGDGLAVGVAVEQPETLNIGGHNLPALVYQQSGNSGGLYNPTANYSYNYAPDLVAKVAYDARFGHFEAFAIGRFFRARVFPNAISLNGSTPSPTPTLGAYTSKTQGGGFGLNARVPVLSHRFEVGAHILAGDGLGRYSTTTLPDATEHADGSLALLTGGSAMGTVEWHATPRLDFYSYYGGEYAKRAYFATGLTVTSGIYAGQPVLTGYGAPTNDVSGCHTEVAPVSSPNGGMEPGTALRCTADTRNIQEGTLGYWYRFYKGPKGTLEQGLQYSYAVKHTWLGIGDPLTSLGGSPKAIDNMWFTSFRFYLPVPEGK